MVDERTPSQRSDERSDRRPPSIEETLGSAGREWAHGEPLRRGASIGRYVLLDQLGAGAMGVVYSAYDPELDRKLAIKVLHPGASSQDAEAIRNRLRREAQALARLTHPNVVAVHDVGTHQGRVFVAMEFVAGKTLRAWLRADPHHPPSVEAVIEVFTAAGRGLAAAHRAGLIHRDFKPENVLLGDDGTVRVVDFGLARRASDIPEPSQDGVELRATATLDGDSPDAITSTAGSSLEMSLTQTGGIMGTPAYMAPEQHLGVRATERSDQFSFCVSLWEALYGERPFAGRDLPSLSLAVTTGRMREPPTDGPHANRVPAYLHRVLLRGLSIEPDDRYPHVDALVDALGRDPDRRRRRIGVIAAANLVAALVIFGAGIWVARQLDDSRESAAEQAACAPHERLAGIWDEERRKILVDRLTMTDMPFAAHTARELQRRLDAYASQWTEAWGETCEAERSLGPGEGLELRRDCLEQRRSELAAFTDALIQSEPEVFNQRAEFVVPAAESLPAIATCRDPARLGAEGSRPDPELRERIVELEARMSEALAIGRLGDPTTGLERAREVLEQARQLDRPRLLIRSLIQMAHLEAKAHEKDGAVALLREAYAIAEREAEDWLRVKAALELIGLLGFDLERPGEAGVWAEVADALLERIGNPDDLRGQWYYEVGTARIRKSEFNEAEAALDKALELYEVAHGSDSYLVDPVLQRLGSVARERGHYERALAYHSRLLERRKAAYGADHPDVAVAYGSLGNDAYFRGDYEEARGYYKEALRIVGGCYGEDSPAYAHRLNNYAAVLERLGELDEAETIYRKLLAVNKERYGERDVRVTHSLQNLGLVLLSANRHAEAAEQFSRSLELRREHHGDDHTATAAAKVNLGYALFRLGEHERARALYDETLATWTEKLGEDHPDLGLVQGNLGELDLAQGRLSRARSHYQRALEITEAAMGSDAADLGYYLTGLARVALSEGDADEAIELCERALEVREGAWLPPGDLGLTQLSLAQALARRGRAEDEARAKRLAAAARKDIVRGGDPELIAEAERVLGRLE